MLYGPPESQVKELAGSQARPSGASLNGLMESAKHRASSCCGRKRNKR